MFVEHKEIGEAQEAPAKVLKLSEAIRIGARIRPQCFGKFFRDGESCALGAAYEAGIGRALEYGGFPECFSDLERKFPMIHELVPSVRGGVDRLYMEIAARNDQKESRESIADWLEAQGY